MTENNTEVNEQTVGRPAGFRDFFPEDYHKINFILETMRRIAREFGYVEYMAPSVELLKLFELKSGEGIITETFKVESRSGQKLVLIPELTPSLSRMLAEKQQNYTKPIRWFSIPKCYRDETLQRGRVKEFWQYNADILGVDNIYADAEIITLLIKVIIALGFTKKQFVVLVNDREFVQQFLKELGVDQFLPIIRILDRKDKIVQEAIEKNLKASFGEEAKDIALTLRHSTEVDESIFDHIPKTKETEELIANFPSFRKKALVTALKKLALTTEQAEKLYQLSQLRAPPKKFLQKVKKLYPSDTLKEALKNLAALSELLESFGVAKYVLFDGSLARGLDYYTGIIFEAWSREGVLPRAIAGGGRYADLVAILGGQPLTGTGFGFGETVIAELMDEYGITPPEMDVCDVYIAPIKLDDLSPVIKLTDKLQKQGLKVIINPFDWRIRRHFENAEKHGVVWMVIAGKKDLSKEAVTLRNIITGDQELIPLKDFVKVIKKKIGKK
jgi:histidyl-tRNA synthetase